MKILVTDGDNRAALAITRSLGSKGHQIVVGEKTQHSLAQSSRYCASSIIYPDPVSDSRGFIETLYRTIRDRHIDIVLPVAEITTAIVTRHKEDLEQCSLVPFPAAEIFHRAANKVDVLALAEKLSVPIPTTVVLRWPGDKPQWPKGLSFPVVVKPHRSRIHVDGIWQSTSVGYAKDDNELNELLARKHEHEYPVLLQERIVGPGVGVFLCYQHGRPVAIFSHKRLREKPPSGGVSVLRESVPVSPHAKRYSEALLDKLGWHGVAMVEFKMDQRDGTLKLMEINGRFWGSLQLAIDAGVDFPFLLIQTLAAESMKPVDAYRIGVKSRWVLGDLDALLMRLFRCRNELHLASGHPGRLRSILDFMNFFDANTRSEVWRFSDINPGLYEARRWFEAMRRREVQSS